MLNLIDLAHIYFEHRVCLPNSIVCPVARRPMTRQLVFRVICRPDATKSVDTLDENFTMAADSDTRSLVSYAVAVTSIIIAQPRGQGAVR